MHSVSVVVMLVLATMASSAPAGDKPYYDLQKAHVYFDKFVKDYNRVYKDDADREVHYRAFLKSLAKINELNAKSDSATFGINQFADYTEEESKTMFGLKHP